MRPSLRHPFQKPEGRPACIAHRGAQAHARENTLAAFRTAADLGADMWELDLRLTADGVPVVSHDDRTGPVHGTDLAISGTTFAELRAAVPDLPCFAEVVALARTRDQGLYVEVKATGAGLAALKDLEGFAAAALGSFDSDEVRTLIAADCPWPVAVLVRTGEDPVARAHECGADIVHLCWERASNRPQDLVTPALLRDLAARALGLVLWHEERPDVLADLQSLPALGICTDKPELMRGYQVLGPTGIEVVCHRGINHIAPENTLAAARLAYEMGCDWLEIDVRETADGEIVAMHDPTLERTTNGHGRVADRTLADLRTLDAGGWFSPFYAGEPVQTLREAIALCQSYGRRLYIENKSADVTRLWALVVEMGFEDRCFFWSPDPALLAALHRHAPRARIKSNIAHHGSFADMCRTLAPAICEIQPEDWDTEASLCRAHGIKPMLQYFGTDPTMFDGIAQIGPEMANIDRADMLLAALRRRREARPGQ